MDIFFKKKLIEKIKKIKDSIFFDFYLYCLKNKIDIN